MRGLTMLGCPNSNKKKFIFITLTTLFSKKNIKFKVALRPRLGLKPMVISVRFQTMVAES